MHSKALEESIQRWLNLTKVTVEHTKTRKEVTARLENILKAEKNKKEVPTTAVGDTAESATRNLFHGLRGGFVKTHRGNFNFPWI
tara:strand:- start:2865 stop:3119 length:255 start_codon:yes stop_codon:yes gene_type:complete